MMNLAVTMKRVLITVLFTITLVACTKKEKEDILPEEGKIYATIQEYDVSDATVQLNDMVKTEWDGDDIIRTFVPGKISDYKFDSKTGDHTGSFTWLSDYGACEGLDSGAYALYPVESYLGYRVNSAFIIDANLKDVQKYKADSFSEGVNIMVGKSTDQVNYSFENFLGYLRLSLTGDKKVRSITIKGNGLEDTAGDLCIYADTPSNWMWSIDGKIYDETTIDCGEDGVMLSVAEPTHFYIAFPPMVFFEGMTATIRYTDGSIYPESTTEIIEIKQNQILLMETINTSATQWQIVKIYHTSASIETPIISALSGVTSLSGIVDYGDGNIKTLSDLENTHNYTDGEESHIVTVQVKDANTITLNSCKGVSKIDFSKF